MKESETLYVTKKEFYKAMVAVFVFLWCIPLIMWSKDKGFGAIYLCAIAGGLQMYYCFKLKKLKAKEKN
jgi:hypothetical protein